MWAVFAKVAEVANYLKTNLSTTRAGKIDNLDATISSRASASTALSNAVWTNTRAGYLDGVNNINTNVGSNSDASSPTGSVHAKLKDLKANLGGGVGDYTRFHSGGVSPTIEVGTYITLLDVQGMGELSYCYAHHNSNNKLRITVDGVVIYHEAGSGLIKSSRIVSDNGQTLVRNAMSLVYNQKTSFQYILLPSENQSTGDRVVVLEENVPFKSSLKIEIGRVSTPSTISYEYEGVYK